MIKIIFSWLVNIIVLLALAGVLTWLHGVLGSSPFFIFFIILASGWSYTSQQKQIQKLHERILRLEGFER